MALRSIVLPLAVAVVVFTPFTSGAEGRPASGFVLYEYVQSSFKPKRIYALLFKASGELTQIRGYGLSQPGSVTNFLVGSFVPQKLIETNSTSRVAYTFFLVGTNTEFHATPVKLLSMAALQEQQIDLERLKADLRALIGQKDEIETEVKGLERELSSVRSQLMDQAGLDSLLQVKRETQAQEELTRILSEEAKALAARIEQARNLDEPKEYSDRLQSLSKDLEDTAKVTALADRLATRRKEAALESARRKLALVREMQDVDRERLAREVMNLRRKRRRLEIEKGLAPAEERMEHDF